LVLLWERLRAQIGGYDNAGIDVYIAPSVVGRKKGNERRVETETATLFIMSRQKCSIGRKYTNIKQYTIMLKMGRKNEYKKQGT